MKSSPTSGRKNRLKILFVDLGMELTPKQKRFCEEYLIDLNATQAAIRAGYSEKTARSVGAENLTKPDIANRISEQKKKLSEKTGVSAERVINELIKMGFSNIQDYIDELNTIKDLSQIPREIAASVKSIKKTTTTWGSGDTAGEKISVSFEVYDKLSALEKLGKHLGIFEADNKQRTPPNVPRPTMRLPDGTILEI